MLSLPFVVVACSSSGGATLSGAASLSGASIGIVRSAALVESGSITEAGVSAPTTYVQFFTNASGEACATLESDTSAGSLSVLANPATLPGQTLTFGTSDGPVLTVTASGAIDGGLDAGSDAEGSDAGVSAPSLVAVSGTVAFNLSDGNLTGTVDAEMVLATSPGSAPVHVTGTFTAPACGAP